MNEPVNRKPETADNNGEPETAAAPEKNSPEDAGDFRAAAGNLRVVSYVVLFIAAVFITNAMETGSYRTPWPVAVIAALTGLGLFGYSWYLRSRPPDS